MKKILLPLIGIAALGASAHAQIVINDGTTASNLTVVFTGGTGASASATSNGSVVSFTGNTSSTTSYRWRGVGYGNTAQGLMTGNVYSVSANYDIPSFEYQGGVMGLFNTSTNVGIFLGYETASGGTSNIRIQEWNLTNGFSGGITTSNFRNADGTAFSLTGNTLFGGRNNALFSLNFTAATAGDILLWGSAATRVVATVTEGSTSFTKTFLTSLNPATSRVGYAFGGEGLGNPAAANNGAFDNLTVIPEPSSFALLAGGLAALAIYRRRRA